MKKFLFLFFLLVMDVNAQGHIYISKRDISNDTTSAIVDNVLPVLGVEVIKA